MKYRPERERSRGEGHGLYSAPLKAPRSPETDLQLLEACRGGNPGAWERLVVKYRHLVYSIALRSRLDADQAGDVFQTVFLNLLRSVEDVHPQESLIPWLVTTARREAWRVARQTRRATEDDVVLDTLPAAGSTQDDLEEIERQIAVRGSLDRLDARCRRLLEVLFYGDPAPSYADIARDLRMPVPSIGPTRMRCLEKLRRELEKDPRF